MTNLDYQIEQDLRAQTLVRDPKDAARVLADFYESLGQPSRAVLWREERVHAKQKYPVDLIVRDPRRQRRNAMWFLANITSQAAVARAFRSSPSWTRTMIGEVESEICAAANAERHHPTMVATLRLQAAGALPRPYERGSFELGEVPPKDWPSTTKESSRA